MRISVAAAIRSQPRHHRATGGKEIHSMTRIRSIELAIALVLAVAGTAGAAEVTLDGIVVPEASATMSIDVPITEYRDGTEQCPRLIPGCPKLEVCIAAPARVAPLDAQLAGATPARFTVGVEDGRSFGRCVPASLETRGGKHRKHYEYCLRCETLTGP
jgi:hypothetical protein